jgi:RraA family protein
MSEYTVNPPAAVATASLVEAFRDVITPHISDNLGRLTGIRGLTRFHRQAKLVGTALTIKVRPGDNTIIYKALQIMSPGHVLVIDGGGDLNNALVGDIIMTYAKLHGCVGFVVDGAIRDSVAFYDADFPCYARSTIHRGPYKGGPAALNIPVSIGGQVVNPGDIVVADEDGIVTFAQADAETILAAARITAAKEDAIKEDINSGKRDIPWLSNILQPYNL